MASSVLPCSCSAWYLSLAACASAVSLSFLFAPTLSFATSSVTSVTVSRVMSRAALEWFGFASISSDSSSSSSSDGGRSPTSTAMAFLRAMAASLRAFFSFLRSSRLRAPWSSCSESEPDSSSDPDPDPDSASPVLSWASSAHMLTSLPSASRGRRSREKCLPPGAVSGGSGTGIRD